MTALIIICACCVIGGTYEAYTTGLRRGTDRGWAARAAHEARLAQLRRDSRTGRYKKVTP